ncbi:MAG: DUF882 domain-containing protein [Hyphomicrobium sp.]
MALRRSGAMVGVLAVATALGLAGDALTGPPSGDRTISFYHIHTNERLTVTYKKDGQYVPEAMKQIDWIMRDWRKNESIRMDPATIDLAWEMYNELGSSEPISIICGYRSQGTNEMLRKTRGGQASQSQHMTGKAIDITFPDVPLKRIRYSALIRERGGVGYYPTSGIPFVHVDTARVRAWPRLPRQELALLFPDGHTRHQPASGGPITRADVSEAQTKYRELAVQIAQFHDDRRAPRPTLVASAKPAERKAITVAALGTSASVTTPERSPAAQPIERKPFAVASLDPASLPLRAPPTIAAESDDLALGWDVDRKSPDAKPDKQVAALAPAPAKPKLVAEPKIVDRSSRFSFAPSDKDRLDMTALVQKASLGLPPPKLVEGPKPAARPQKALAETAAAIVAEKAPAPVIDGPKLAALAPEKSPASVTDMSPDSLGVGWVQAPEFDEDHPEELAYRPFPLAPLLTDTPSAHDPQLAGLQHPDVAATLEMIDDVGAIPPMRFRPGRQVAQVMWAQQFEGKAVHLDALREIDGGRIAATGIESRPVQTSSR